MVMELLIGKDSVLFERFTLPNESNLVAPPTIEVPVETVIARIQFPTDKPFYIRFIEVILQDLIPFLVPVKMCPLTPPKIHPDL